MFQTLIATYPHNVKYVDMKPNHKHEKEDCVVFKKDGIECSNCIKEEK